MNDNIIIVSNIVTAVATMAIAIFTWCSYCISQQIKRATEDQSKREEEFKNQIKDLYQAIVISNVLSGPSSYGALTQAIDAFKSQYKGKFKIFD